MVTGRIHSRESFGAVDGPGIRYVVFMQGCPMRCLYCHNPDSWSADGGEEVTAESILSDYSKNSAFYKNGGITVSGGEPLMQIDFLTELFEGAKKQGIHTCIDTSGVTFNGEGTAYEKKLSRLLESTDLILLDIKHTDPKKHKELTGHSNEGVFAFAKYLAKKNIPIWVRRVVVEGYTDGKEENEALGRFLATLPNLRALEVLPYHDLGKSKYAELGIDYPLADLRPLDSKTLDRVREEILASLRSARIENRNN